MKTIFNFLLFSLLGFSLFAQNGDKGVLPNYPTLKELHTPYETFEEENVSAAPLPKNLRSMAEWEELQGLTIAWQGTTGHKVILAQITKAARLETNVIILCNDSTVMKACESVLTSQNVDYSSNVTFVLRPTDSIWIRDYGANPVYQNDVDTLGLVDWIYNRNRPNDNTSPIAVAKYLQTPYYQTITKPDDLVHTGGNFMSDGLGNAFSSKLVLEENTPAGVIKVSTKTEGQIDSIMQKYMGINRYTKMDVLPYDAIHHIDMHMKLLDEETLLMAEYPKDVADGPQIEANLQYVLNNFKTPYGKPYKVVRILSPPDATGKYPDTKGQYRTYSNMVFVNKTVIVPFYETKYDTTAQKILEKAMPGYKIVGVNCNSIIGSLGAIHCITKEIGVKEPLWITHEKKTDIADYNGQKIPVSARVQHIKGIKNAKIWYKISTEQTFQSFDLTENGNTWSGNFSNLPNNSVIQYYIESEAKNGKKITRPITAPKGFYSFKLSNGISQTIDLQLNNLKIYPNPARAITCIEFENPNKGELNISIFDVLGKKINTIHQGEAEQGLQHFFFNAADYVKGFYFIKIKNKDGEVVRKVVVE